MSDIPVNAAVLRGISPHVARQPILPEDFIWRCPIDACPHIIDFYNLTGENLRCLTQKAANFLQGNVWSYSNPDFLESFYDMVEQHYFTHLHTSGIKMVGYRTGKVDVHGNQVLQERKIEGPGQLRKDDKASPDIMLIWKN